VPSNTANGTSPRKADVNSAWIHRQTATPEARRLYEQERLVLWVSDALARAMVENGLSKADLAEKLGTSRAHITQVLSGSRNMTLRTVADLAWACNQRAEIRMEALLQDDPRGGRPLFEEARDPEEPRSGPQGSPGRWGEKATSKAPVCRRTVQDPAMAGGVSQTEARKAAKKVSQKSTAAAER
jgi:transcriptional regulator with XRE-family HTH domain